VISSKLKQWHVCDPPARARALSREADISGEEVENYLLSNDLVKPTDRPVDVPTNAACTDEEHAKMATKTVRFF
jgi:hypothetical protein